MKFTNPGIWLVAALSLAALRMQLSLSPPAVHAQTPFYQGKTITIINGNPPGGTADRRMRVFMPFLKKYIPGEPTILAEYMAGAGGRKLAITCIWWPSPTD
jgi:tripartite-type tricarboxylate transporter receptor subunit TctC